MASSHVYRIVHVSSIERFRIKYENLILLIFAFIDTVLFDNSNSYFTNKRIMYSVVMASSVDVDELEQGAEALDEL